MTSFCISGTMQPTWQSLVFLPTRYPLSRTRACPLLALVRIHPLAAPHCFGYTGSDALPRRDPTHSDECAQGGTSVWTLLTESGLFKQQEISYDLPPQVSQQKETSSLRSISSEVSKNTM